VARTSPAARRPGLPTTQAWRNAGPSPFGIARLTAGLDDANGLVVMGEIGAWRAGPERGLLLLAGVDTVVDGWAVEVVATEDNAPLWR